MPKLNVNWEEVKKAYEQGNDRKDICNAFNVSEKTLRNKIWENKWTIGTNKGQIETHVNGLRDNLSLISKDIRDAPSLMKPIIAQKVKEAIEDSELMATNRMILRATQKVMLTSLKSNEVGLKDIRTITGAVREIEGVINPQPKNNVNVAVQNNNEVNVDEKLTKEELEDILRQKGLPIEL